MYLRCCFLVSHLPVYHSLMELVDIFFKKGQYGLDHTSTLSSDHVDPDYRALFVISDIVSCHVLANSMTAIVCFANQTLCMSGLVTRADFRADQSTRLNLVSGHPSPLVLTPLFSFVGAVKKWHASS